MFRIDSFFWRLMSRLGDFLWLSFLFFFSTLPILTVPAALYSLFVTTQQSIEENGLPITKAYFQNFKKYFKPSIKMGIILSIYFLILGSILNFLSGAHQDIAQLIGIMIIFLLAFTIVLLLFILPQLGKATIEKSTNIFAWSFYLLLRHIPWSILLIGILSFTIWMTANFMPIVFFSLSAFVYLDCLIVNKLSQYSYYNLRMKNK